MMISFAVFAFFFTYALSKKKSESDEARNKRMTKSYENFF